MSKRNSTTRARRSAQAGSFELFVHPQRSTPARALGLMWRLRVEITLIIGVVLVWSWLTDRLPTWGAALVLLGSLTLLLIIPVTRRYVVCHLWCTLTRHRVRSCLVQARVMTHEGLLPLFVWTRPTPVGERLWLLLRPGLSSRDLEVAAEKIAAACWARNARVQVNPDRASTVWIDVIRRDPLAGTDQITSPLLRGVPVEDDTTSDEDGQLLALPDRTTVHPTAPPSGVSAPGGAPPPIHVVSAPTGTRPTKRTSPRTTPVTEDQSVAPGMRGRSGEDVSDYV